MSILMPLELADSRSVDSITVHDRESMKRS